MDDLEGIDPKLWAALDGRLWHATSPGALLQIMSDGEIHSFGDRYCNSLCKKLGGVSLMDFGLSATNQSEQAPNWMGWLGYQQKSRIAVWIEIDRVAVSDRLLDAKAFHAHWADGNYGTQIIPGVEACHRGPIPAAAFAGILCVDQFDRSVFRSAAIADTTDCVAMFEATLAPAPPENSLADALRRSREKARRTYSNKRPDECS